MPKGTAREARDAPPWARYLLCSPRAFSGPHLKHRGNVALFDAIAALRGEFHAEINKSLEAANAKAVVKDGDSVLDVAIALPSESLIAFLLDDAKVAPDERAIDWCVINGKVMPLTMLVAHGGAVTDRHLAAAVKCGHYDMVKYLVSLGCDVNAKDVHGVFNGAQVEIRNYLIANGYRESNSNVDFVKYQ